MRRWRCSIGFLAAVLAVLALDLAVIKSLARGTDSNPIQWLYLVPIGVGRAVTFLGLALGVLPMASVLVLATTSQVLTIRRGGTISAFGFGFLAFGWLSVFLYMAIAALSPPAIDHYIQWCGGLVGPAVIRIIGDNPPEWLLGTLEISLVVIDLLLPEFLVALAGGWLVGRSGGRLGIERRAAGNPEETGGHPSAIGADAPSLARS
jgi:hypothetical protein